MKIPEIGDRVRVYGAYRYGTIGGGMFTDVAPEHEMGTVGTVSFVDARKRIVDVRFGSLVLRAHWKQCRKLVKKEPRRVWVHPGLLSGAIASNHQDATPDRVHGERIGWLEFREVRKAKP